MKYLHCLLSASLTLALVGCGNSSDDRPTAPPTLPEPPPTGHQPDLTAYSNIATLDLKALAGLSGAQLIDGMEDQLNATLNKSKAGNQQFTLSPRWGSNDQTWDTDNLRVIEIDGQFALETHLAAQAVGKPSSSNQVANGFSFLITLPNGLVQEATLSYQVNLSKQLGYGDATKSPDYIFFPGFTSGDPAVLNKPSDPGTGFTYKYSTDRYGYLNTRFTDPTDKTFYNQQLKFHDKGIKMTANQWNLIQQKLTANTFNGSVASSNGALDSLYNTSSVSTAAGTPSDRVMIDTTHQYNLQALVEVYRHYKHGSDAETALGEQVIRLKDLTLAWNNESVVLPVAPEEDQPDLTDYPNVTQLNLESLHGLNGPDLFQGIEDQLNASLPPSTPSDKHFTVTPQWGTGSGNWDINNLEVVENNGQYILQTTIAAESVGQPSDKNPITNGFSFLIELPNGLVKEATLAYQFKLSTPIGYNDPAKTPDYLFMPGFTSGNPLVENSASPLGSGFTYKYTTDRYSKFNTRFMDVTDNAFFNQELQKEGTGIRITANNWNLVQQKLITNDFIGSVATNDGSLQSLYNKAHLQPKVGDVINRTQIDNQHAYQLSALIEVYRHFKHSADAEADLKEQIIQFKNITLAWKNDEVTLPEPSIPVTPNACSNAGFTDSRLLDLSALSDLTGQALLDGIGDQLGGLAPGTIAFDFGIDSIAVVADGEDFALEITYGAGLTDHGIAENGMGFQIPFPVKTNQIVRGACFAYDLHIAKDIATSANNDYIFIPGIRLNNGTELLSDHRYSTNKYKRFAAKFTNPPHEDLGWLDYSGNGYVNANKWYQLKQTLNFNDAGRGFIDFTFDGNTYFKPISGKFGGIAFEKVEHQLVSEDNVNNVSFSANFDTYRHESGGTNTQTFKYKNIAIGWNSK